MKKIPKQQYTAEFKEQAIRRGLDVGIGVAARELGLVVQTLRNWVTQAAAGKPTSPEGKPVTPEQMELSRLRAENARLKMHVDILKNRLCGFATAPMNRNRQFLHSRRHSGQRPPAFWRHSSPSKNLAQGKLRTQLWWHLA